MGSLQPSCLHDVSDSEFEDESLRRPTTARMQSLMEVSNDALESASSKRDRRTERSSRRRPNDARAGSTPVGRSRLPLNLRLDLAIPRTLKSAEERGQTRVSTL